MAGLSDLGNLVQSQGLQLAEDNEPVKKESRRKARMAGEGITMLAEEIDDLLLPYSEYERDNRLPNYYGRTEREWKQDNVRIKKELLNARGDRSEQIAILKENGFLNERDQYQILKYLRGDKPLQNQQLWLPGAAADENQSRLVLLNSGFDPVRYGNDIDPMGTDLKADINGATRYIDAQQRTNDDASLNLAVTKKDRRGYGLLVDNPNEKLAKLIEMAYNLNPRISEGKLLHTEDRGINTINSTEFRDGGGLTHVKDYLISSNRRGLARQGYGKGPYDPMLPQGWTMVDLNKARDMLLQMTPAQMASKYDIRFPDFGSGIVLQLPEQFIKKELQDRSAKLGKAPLRQLVRR
jgi:hypothetical protein